MEPVSFESTLHKGIHVLGDAAVMSGLAKSAFIAGEAGKACAAAIVARLAGREPAQPLLGNTCYSVVAPGYAYSMKHVYHPQGDQLVEVPGTGGTSPVEADAAVRAREAHEAEAWFDAITKETFA